jgi:hypothetical protein
VFCSAEGAERDGASASGSDSGSDSESDSGGSEESDESDEARERAHTQRQASLLEEAERAAAEAAEAAAAAATAAAAAELQVRCSPPPALLQRYGNCESEWAGKDRNWSLHEGQRPHFRVVPRTSSQRVDDERTLVR